jgi:hypothetical protein
MKELRISAIDGDEFLRIQDIDAVLYGVGATYDGKPLDPTKLTLTLEEPTPVERAEKAEAALLAIYDALSPNPVNVTSGLVALAAAGRDAMLSHPEQSAQGIAQRIVELRKRAEAAEAQRDAALAALRETDSWLWNKIVHGCYGPPDEGE